MNIGSDIEQKAEELRRQLFMAVDSVVIMERLRFRLSKKNKLRKIDGGTICECCGTVRLAECKIGYAVVWKTTRKGNVKLFPCPCNEFKHSVNEGTL